MLPPFNQSYITLLRKKWRKKATLDGSSCCVTLTKGQYKCYLEKKNNKKQSRQSLLKNTILPMFQLGTRPTSWCFFGTGMNRRRLQWQPRDQRNLDSSVWSIWNSTTSPEHITLLVHVHVSHIQNTTQL